MRQKENKISRARMIEILVNEIEDYELEDLIALCKSLYEGELSQLSDEALQRVFNLIKVKL